MKAHEGTERVGQKQRKTKGGKRKKGTTGRHHVTLLQTSTLAYGNKHTQL